MAYASRNRPFPHDPASTSIFIHGGTCLMHSRNSPFKGSARPNHFSLSFPQVNGKYFDHPSRHLAAPTFSSALAQAIAVREAHPELHHCTIYACTDLILDNGWSGRVQVQAVSPRLIRRAAASIPAQAAAA